MFNASHSAPPPHLDIGSNIFIVISAYNEAGRLGAVLESLRPWAPNVVVVDDGSSDETANVAAAYPCHVLRHCVNRGAGAGRQTGLTYALAQGADVLVTFDADGQHDAAQIPDVIAPILRGEADVVLGSRFLGQTRNMPTMRHLVLWGGRLFTRFMSGMNLTDCHNGFRAFSRGAAGKIHLLQDRMAYASELYDQIHAAGLVWVEVPVTITYSAEVLAKGQSNLNSLSIMFQYLIKRFF